MSNFYDFNLKDIDGTDFSFRSLEGKVVLAVNTASKCGHTPQYEGLQQLYEKYRDQGFVMLGFPANDFGAQEPGSNSEIKEFCKLRYGVTFPMFEKIEVTGSNRHALYEFFVSGDGKKEFAGPIKWNFTKFIIDRSGAIAGRFEPSVKPADIESAILKLL